MLNRGIGTVGFVVFLGSASATGAQVIASDEWRQGTALAVFGGVTTSSGSSAATGGTVSWEMLPRLTIDGSGTWHTRQRGVSAFTGLMGVRVNVTPPARVVPFVSAGVGLHRASIAAAASEVPAFYRKRIADGAFGPRDHTFNDFALSIGGGTDVFLRRHVALRPDVRVIVARGSGQTHTVAVYGLHLAVHFEEHPVTP